MANSPNLNLPYIAAGQAQKHITHNEAIRALDAIVQLSVLDRNLTAPPVSPNEGDRYIIGASPTSTWAGKDNQIAAWQDSAWVFYPPNEGWLAWVADEDKLLAWDGVNWVIAGGESVNPIDLVGVNTTADSTNRLAVSSPNSLFTHEGNSHQIKINKNATSDTASVLFQTNWSGRAEFGLAGDDDWHVKVSSDGSTWHEALIADRTTGAVRFPAGVVFSNQQIPVGQFVFTPGGDGTVSFYRNDTYRKQNPRSYTISSVSNDVITISTTDAAAIFNDPFMNGVSYVRIWNMSKSPEQSAWVKAQPANNQIVVLDSADISGWVSGETIQVGDPTSITPNRVIAIDISPMMQNVLGVVFRQKGIICKSGFSPENGYSMGFNITPSGATGSFVGTNSAKDGSWTSGQIMIPCSTLSPISNSNLVYVREQDSGGHFGNTLLSCMALFG